MKIVKCTPKNAKILASLIADCLKATYDAPKPEHVFLLNIKFYAENLEYFFAKAIDLNYSEIYILMDETKIVGGFTISLIKEAEKGWLTGEIENAYILKHYRHHNYGSQCLAFIEQRFKELGFEKIYIWLLNDQEHAHHFFQKHGFVFDGYVRQATLNNFFQEHRYSKKIAATDIIRYYQANNAKQTVNSLAQISHFGQVEIVRDT